MSGNGTAARGASFWRAKAGFQNRKGGPAVMESIKPCAWIKPVLPAHANAGAWLRVRDGPA